MMMNITTKVVYLMVVIVVDLMSIHNTVLNVNVLVSDLFKNNAQEHHNKLILQMYLGCDSNNQHWIGDGYCDDETNN